MARRRGKSKGIDWHLPGKKKPFASSTVAARDLIVAMSGEYDAVYQIYNAIEYDMEAKEILRNYIEAGYGDWTLADLGID